MACHAATTQVNSNHGVVAGPAVRVKDEGIYCSLQCVECTKLHAHRALAAGVGWWAGVVEIIEKVDQVSVSKEVKSIVIIMAGS